MTLDDLIHMARDGGAAVVYYPEDGGAGVFLVEPEKVMPEALQLELWRSAKSFYIVGGPVPVYAIWNIWHFPTTPEAEAIGKRFGMEVTALVARPVKPTGSPPPTMH